MHRIKSNRYRPRKSILSDELLSRWKTSASELKYLLKMPVLLKITLLTETHLTDRLTLKWQCTLKVQQSLIILVCIRKAAKRRMAVRLILCLKTLARSSLSPEMEFIDDSIGLTRLHAGVNKIMETLSNWGTGSVCVGYIEITSVGNSEYSSSVCLHSVVLV
jgi:hypothetical protein